MIIKKMKLNASELGVFKFTEPGAVFALAVGGGNRAFEKSDSLSERHSGSFLVSRDFEDLKLKEDIPLLI